jgi:thioester reductase-like protein
MKLLVSGLTGQLGSGLVEAVPSELVELVPLVRPLASRDGAARLRAAFPTSPELAARVIEGDVTRPHWGLDAATIRQLAIGIDGVLNLAGETNWAAGRRELDATNVRGAVNGYELTRALEAASGARKLYCHVSSIHAAGGMTGRVPETPFEADERRTPYELSKWLGEVALLGRAERQDAPSLCIARVGGLLGSSATGVTRRRNSLYMLADRVDGLPFGILPISRSGRVDMLPRDVAARLLIDALLALHATPPEAPQIIHVCAGESAPTTDAVLRALASLDEGHRAGRLRALRVPTRGIVMATQQLPRYQHLARTWHNALIGLRYLTFERTFERSRLAALVSETLPVATIEQLIRLAFELPAPRVLPTHDDLSLARFAR